ncbi:hypothetical protein [Francisella philomiragia]|uniref:hypothetical protein n=1 Tax=Francisella philomiragia TaxID=28110 RepID=UPI00190613E3|nr:hypothetical protein [Francisella philomiragia]MBK2270178.1 hypothetical protein [Francisella philomiragia]MBK2275842.1 hypothetical protein [Francisella philomiragia]MBK2305055.1 hypothetical protein [Francisella philomiragia]
MKFKKETKAKINLINPLYDFDKRWLGEYRGYCIYFDISDQEFLDKINNKNIALSKNNTLVCDLSIVPQFNNDSSIENFIFVAENCFIREIYEETAKELKKLLDEIEEEESKYYYQAMYVLSEKGECDKYDELMDLSTQKYKQKIDYMNQLDAIGYGIRNTNEELQDTYLKEIIQSQKTGELNMNKKEQNKINYIDKHYSNLVQTIIKGFEEYYRITNQKLPKEDLLESYNILKDSNLNEKNILIEASCNLISNLTKDGTLTKYGASVQFELMKYQV